MLQARVATMLREKVNILSSAELMMLFMLGCPGKWETINVFNSETDASERSMSNSRSEDFQELHQHYNFRTVMAPHEISLRIHRICGAEGEETKLILQLFHPSFIEGFVWQDWINSVMGFIKGMKIQAENLDQVQKQVVEWRTRMPVKIKLSKDMLSVTALHSAVPDLPGTLRIWTGWPIFDIKIAQFAMNNWMRAAGFLCGLSDVVRPMIENWDVQFKKEVERAEEGILEILRNHRRWSIAFGLVLGRGT